MKREMRKPFRIMFWILVGCAVFALPMQVIMMIFPEHSKDRVATNSSNQKKTIVVSEKGVGTNRQTQSSQSKPRIEGILDSGARVVPVAVDRKTLFLTFDRTYSKEALRDKLWNVPAGTRVRVIGSGLIDSNVEILEGLQAGRNGWVPYEWVVEKEMK